MCFVRLTAGVLWLIFFGRLFGPVVPSTCDFMDVAYPVAANMPDLDTLIDQRIDELIKREFAAVRAAKRALLSVSFFDSATKKKLGWFGLGDDKRRWETWSIAVTCLPVGAEQLPASLKLFEEAVARVWDLVDKHKEHIPPIVTLDTAPFPYVISLGAEPHDETWGRYIKKMLD